MSITRVFLPRRFRLLLAVLLLLAAWPRAARSQSADNVLVIANAASPASLEVADYYLKVRGIAEDHLLRLDLPEGEEIGRGAFVSGIEGPVAHWLTTHAAQDRILYLVLIKGMPLRITGTGTSTGSVASVDSELTLLYRKMAGMPVTIAGPLKNPYFGGDAPLAAAKPFTHRTQDIYLVARLDGYTVADVKALIDRGAAPQKEGVVLLDGRVEPTSSPGNRWLVAAANALRKTPEWAPRTMLDTTAKVLEGDSVLGYYSWGSSDAARTSRFPKVQFVPGAIAGEFVSTDARTFLEPPATWTENDRPFWGSSHSLVGDLIRGGITGVAGYVAEPYLSGTVRPDILFPAYVAGFNLVEAFYLAMPSLSWTGVVIGDPLCAPFRTAVLLTADLDPPVDATTELPQFLSARRVASLVDGGTKVGAARLFAKSEVRIANGDAAGMQQALEQATAIDESLITAQLTLAGIYAATRQWDAEINRLRRVLAVEPNHPTALNDLAYALATEKHAPAEALPFAKRAILQPGVRPEVADTLAWVYHLLGQDSDAEEFAVVAARNLPNNIDAHVHAAVILAGVGKMDAAGRELDIAVRLAPALAEREDLRELRARIDAAK
ncbi:MAG: TIGR03790 family protein [Acidobacteriota bacterium]